jgi:hypothetical protein
VLLARAIVQDHVPSYTSALISSLLRSAERVCWTQVPTNLNRRRIIHAALSTEATWRSQQKRDAYPERTLWRDHGERRAWRGRGPQPPPGSRRLPLSSATVRTPRLDAQNPQCASTSCGPHPCMLTLCPRQGQSVARRSPVQRQDMTELLEMPEPSPYRSSWHCPC